jgi:hypothetical protein
MSTAYPKRPPFFANKFCRLIGKVCLANEIGADACYLLITVAHTEDAKSYRGNGVTFFNEQLMPLIGCKSVDSLARIRAKAIDAGWLYYRPGGKGIPGTYWVLTPVEFDRTDNAPIDVNDDDYLADTSAEMRNKAGKNPEGSAERTQKEVRKEPREKPEESAEHSSLPKDTIPKTLSHTGKENPPTPQGGPKDLFGSELKEKRKRNTSTDPPKPRQPQPIDPLFEVICELVGDAFRVPKGSRIARIAREMLAAGLTADELRTLPAVVGKHQPFRKVMDLNTVADCWPMIKTPPKPTTIAPGGTNSPVFKTKAEKEIDYMAEQFASIQGAP